MQATNDYLIVKKDVIEEKKSAGGIIIDSAFHHLEELTKKNICYATVVYDNENIDYLNAGDRIVMNPNKGRVAPIDYEDFTVIKKEQYLAKIDNTGKFIVHPDCVMVKIRKADNDALYSKWILRDDGTKVQLFTQPEPESHSMSRSAIFVSSGEIVQVGTNVKGIHENDIAILDYSVDNCVDNVLYYDDEENKYVVIEGTTTFHEYDIWAYGDRKRPKDNLVAKKGEMDIVSPLLGVIRNDELLARPPYCFLEHKKTIVDKISQAGIEYSEHEEVLERKVLSVSERGNKKYGIKKGQTLIVKDTDIFDVQAGNFKIQCIMDEDVLMGK